MHWYTLAASKGCEDSMFRIGMMYHHGDGRPVDMKKAYTWLKQAADKGSYKARGSIGTFYLHGCEELGIVANLKTAKQMIGDAAKTGCSHSQLTMGNIVISESDPTIGCSDEAMKWFKLSAEQGNASAQYMLGCSYIESKHHTKKDALYWLTKAADQGHEMAEIFLDQNYININFAVVFSGVKL